MKTYTIIYKNGSEIENFEGIETTSEPSIDEAKNVIASRHSYSVHEIAIVKILSNSIL